MCALRGCRGRGVRRELSSHQGEAHHESPRTGRCQGIENIGVCEKSLSKANQEPHT